MKLERPMTVLLGSAMIILLAFLSAKGVTKPILERLVKGELPKNPNAGEGPGDKRSGEGGQSGKGKQPGGTGPVIGAPPLPPADPYGSGFEVRPRGQAPYSGIRRLREAETRNGTV